MKKTVLTIVAALALAACGRAPAELSRAYEELPLGSIKPEGWLREALVRQRDGITATLDETYPQVLGADSGWLGGEGDRWERGPYWIDGLLPLAYILDDEALKAKAQKWVEWALASQREDGFFGPEKGYPYIEGLQRGLPHDWWPRIVMLKVLQQYYNATADERVLDFFGGYFRYQLATLPETPLDKWTYWAKYRAGDNLDVVLWYYNIVHEPWLLDLAGLIHSQSFDFTAELLEGRMVSTPGSIHCVNLAQGLKEPVVWWQYAKEDKYLEAVQKGMDDIRRFDGFPDGMFGGDEALHGNNPVQGSELCSAVELMFSYEQMLKITGDTRFAEELERVAFNALPAQTTDDFRFHQYYQQANQVSATLGLHNFDVGQDGTGNVFGFLTAYPCCLTNHHQGWPKFTQNLWLRTPEGGLAALVYAPCNVTTEIAGAKVGIEERTNYPFEGHIELALSLSSPVSFGISLRVPQWSTGETVCINGVPFTAAAEEGSSVLTIKREWKDGDVVTLDFGMKVTTSRWYENSVAVERGPLVYALGIQEDWRHVAFSGDMLRQFGEGCWEVYPASAWNYGLLKDQVLDETETIEVLEGQLSDCTWPWSLDSAPLRLKLKASRIPSWTMVGGDTSQLPFSQPGSGDVNDISGNAAGEVEEISLVPYGCTTLRISEFPVLTH